MVFMGKKMIIFTAACLLGFPLNSLEASFPGEHAAKGIFMSEVERFSEGISMKDFIPFEERGRKENGSGIIISAQIMNQPRQLFPPTPPALKPPSYSPVAPPPLPTDRGAPPEHERGVIDPRTGDFLPAVKGGVTNPRTGDFFPKVEGGYLNPKTGEVIPRSPTNP
jgi:hypothetical protein